MNTSLTTPQNLLDLFLYNPLQTGTLSSLQSASKDYRWRNSANLAGVNLTKLDNGYKFDMLMPGFRKDEISVEYNSELNGVTIHAKREDTAEYDFQTYSVTERTKTLKLPKDIDESNIEVSLENGVLSVKAHFDKKKIERNTIKIK